jgi:hypothetical protein
MMTGGSINQMSGESREVCGKGVGAEYDDGKALEKEPNKAGEQGRQGRYAGRVWEASMTTGKHWKREPNKNGWQEKWESTWEAEYDGRRGRNSA